MRKIPARIARPGMVLGADVRHSDGNILLGRGTELTPDHLRLILQRGVALVSIEEPRDEAPEEPRPLSAEVLREHIQAEGRWYGAARADTLLAEVFKVAVHMAARGRGVGDALP